MRVRKCNRNVPFGALLIHLYHKNTRIQRVSFVSVFYNLRYSTGYCSTGFYTIRYHTILNMAKNASKCAVIGCDSKNKVCHRFPNPKEHMNRLLKWIQIIGPSTTDPYMVYKRKYVCEIHFDSSCSSPGTKRLNANAYPTLHLNTPEITQVSMSRYHTLKIENPKEFIYNIQLNRPDKANAMNSSMWLEIKNCFDELSGNPECRVVVLSANGKLFTSGIDFSDLMNIGEKLTTQHDIARRSKILRTFIKSFQDCVTALEKCDKPVIAAIHNACIGGGVDLISAADIRYCTKDAWFQLKETEIGMAADVGTLQRMPKIIGSMSTFNELAFTARKFDSSEAKNLGFVSEVHSTKDSMFEYVMNIASNIASKSPVGIQMTKRSIIYSRDHTVQDGLDHIGDWNQMLLQSEDFLNASIAVATKNKTPTFSKL